MDKIVDWTSTLTIYRIHSRTHKCDDVYVYELSCIGLWRVKLCTVWFEPLRNPKGDRTHTTIASYRTFQCTEVLVIRCVSADCIRVYNEHTHAQLLVCQVFEAAQNSIRISRRTWKTLHKNLYTLERCIVLRRDTHTRAIRQDELNWT